MADEQAAPGGAGSSTCAACECVCRPFATPPPDSSANHGLVDHATLWLDGHDSSPECSVRRVAAFNAASSKLKPASGRNTSAGSGQPGSRSNTYERAQECAAARAILALQEQEVWPRRVSLVGPGSMRATPRAGAGSDEVESAEAAEAARRAAEASRYGHVEAYQFVGEDSKVHLERRIGNRGKHDRLLSVATVVIVLVIGIVLGCLAAGIVVAVDALHKLKLRMVNSLMHPGGDDGVASGGNMGRAYAAYLFFCVGLIFMAALLTVWSPAAHGSGLPKLKAFLNGCRVPDLLLPKTLFVKARDGPRPSAAAPAIAPHPATDRPFRPPRPPPCADCRHGDGRLLGHTARQGGALPAHRRRCRRGRLAGIPPPSPPPVTRKAAPPPRAEPPRPLSRRRSSRTS